MTDDTKRAVEILRPVMDLLQIQMTATDKVLILKNDAIGISCNSTWATVMEAIGWLFFRVYAKDFRTTVLKSMDCFFREDIQRYWMNINDLKQFGLDDQAPEGCGADLRGDDHETD